MTSPLHKAPQGLLELLRLKTLGRQPTIFADTLAPTVESERFYSLDVQNNGSFVPATSPGGFPLGATDTLLTGPVLVRALSAQIVMGAAGGTYVHWALGCVLAAAGGGPVLSFLSSGALGAVAAGVTFRVGGMLPEPLLLPAGAQLVASIISDAAGADHQISLRTTYANYNGL